MRGRDITRYGYEFNDLWLINTHNGIKEKNIAPIDINNYPAIKAHLDKFWEKLSTRADKGDTPYNLRNCVYTDDFSKQKIVWGEISDKPKFALDFYGKFFAEATTFIMTGENLPYLLPFLNSHISEYYFSTLGTTTGVGTIRWKKYKLEQLPIPRPERLHSDLLQILVSSSQQSEDAIDSIIYKIYSLSEEEIQFVEEFVNR